MAEKWIQGILGYCSGGRNKNPPALAVGSVKWTTYIDRKKIICFDKQKSTKNRMFSCFFNTLKF